MKTPFKCPVCQGMGSSESRNLLPSTTTTEPLSILVPCPACNGRGIIWGGEFEEKTAHDNVSYITDNQIFGKTYLIDCARTNSLYKNPNYIRPFIEEILRVLCVREESSLATLELKPAENMYFAYHSSKVLILARWQEYSADFYLDVFSRCSFDEHLIRELVLKFFNPELYDDAIVVRKAPLGYGKRFIK